MKFTVHREKALDSDNFWIRIDTATDVGKRVSADGLAQKVIFFRYGEPSTHEKLDLAEFIIRHADAQS